MYYHTHWLCCRPTRSIRAFSHRRACVFDARPLGRRSRPTYAMKERRPRVEDARSLGRRSRPTKVLTLYGSVVL